MKPLLKIAGFLAIVTGVIMIAGGIWGIVFTHKNITQEKIITAADASVPGVPLSGPVTLKAQADIIREHTLKITGGKTYAEMSREDPNRNMWVTATTLITALNFAMLAYVFSGFILLFGMISVFTGSIFFVEQRKMIVKG